MKNRTDLEVLTLNNTVPAIAFGGTTALNLILALAKPALLSSNEPNDEIIEDKKEYDKSSCNIL